MASVGKTACGTAHKNVIVLSIKMRVYQSCEQMPGKVLMGSLEFESDDFVAFEEGGAIPCDVKWVTGEARPFSTLKISCGDRLKPNRFRRSLEPGYTVRTRGGRSYSFGKHDLSHDRGGYMFAPSDTPDGDLIGKAGVENADQLARVELQINHGKMGYPLLLRYPAQPLQDWIYRRHTFRLHLELVIGEAMWELDGPLIVHPAYEFVSDTNKTSHRLKEALTVEYGDPSKIPPLHARDWLSLLNESTEISWCFMQAIRDAVTFINARIRDEARYGISVAEIACTFLCEGAVMVLEEGIRCGALAATLRFGGYGVLGIDSFVTRYRANRHHEQDFTSDALRHFIETNSNLSPVVNERKGRFETFDTLTLVDAVYAVAAMYSSAKDAFADDLVDEGRVSAWTGYPKDLPNHVQYFWSTLYFNTGPESAGITLQNRGLEYHDLIWAHEDNCDRFAHFEKYNANWRTATFRLIEARGNL